MPDRQMEYLAALALNGGRAASNAIARSLDRTLPELSSLRDDLIREGDIYSPQRGYVALTMPIFSSFVLARYEHARTVAEIDLLSLEQMRRNRDHTATPRPVGGVDRRPASPAPSVPPTPPHRDGGRSPGRGI